MLFDRVDFVRFEFRIMPAGAGERAEGAVLLVAARASGDLGHFRSGEPPVALAVELRESGKGDMFDIEVEPHADSVGGDEIIDLAGLVQLDLGIARLGLSAPMTTAAPPRKRRSISAIA